MQGLQATAVTIEVNATRGVRFVLVGLPDNAVKESHERILAAIENSGFTFPTRQITINLSPADIRPRVVAERQQHRTVLAPQKPLPHKAFHGFRPHGIAPRQPQQQSGYPCAAHAEQAPEQRPQSPPRCLRRPQRHQQLRDDEKRKQRRYHRCSAKLYAVPNPLCRNGFAAQQQNGQPAGRAAGQPKDPSLQSHHRRYFMHQPPPDMRGDRQLFRLRRIGFFTRGVRPSGSGYRRWSRWQNCQKSCRG